MDCCQDIPTLSCLMVDIEKRITPLQFSNQVLTVDIPITVQDSLDVGGATISVENDHINLPARTLVNGAPLLSSAFENDIFPLPINTMIDGYFPITEQYYYYFTATNGSFQYNGYILNGQPTSVSTRVSNSNQRCFSFVAPEDCVLTSLTFLLTFVPGNYGTSPIASVMVDVMDTNMSVYYTGVYIDVPAPSSNTLDRMFVETQFQYYVQKGDSVAVWVQRNILAMETRTAFATLGFKVLPPQSLATLACSFFDWKTTITHSQTPFNNILNSIINRPIHIVDQLEILQTCGKLYYGRKLTNMDYKQRLSVQEPIYDDQEQFVLFFCNKKSGWCMDISSSFENTKNLREEHSWQGVLIGDRNDREDVIDMNDDEFLDNMSQLDFPLHMDYLSMDFEEDMNGMSIEKVLSVIDKYKFAVVTFRHNGDPDMQSIIGNALIYSDYRYLFVNVLVEKGKESNVLENWYAHPDFIDPQMIQRIQEHPSNNEFMSSQTCIQLLQQLFLW